MNARMSEAEYNSLPYREDISLYPVLNAKYRMRDRVNTIVVPRGKIIWGRDDTSVAMRWSDYYWESFGVTFTEDAEAASRLRISLAEYYNTMKRA